MNPGQDMQAEGQFFCSGQHRKVYLPRKLCFREPGVGELNICKLGYLDIPGLSKLELGLFPLRPEAPT